MLTAFCNQFVAFFEDLSLTYPEENDISLGYQALKLMKQANPRLIHSVFLQVVDAEFGKNILEENEEYVVERAKTVLETEYANMAYIFRIFDKHWSTMSDTNKEHIWKYLKSLVLLANKVPKA
jgi:hypothetical protein